MADPAIIEISGLQLSNSTFSGSPPGSLSVATNLVISQKGVAEPRNGQERAATLPSAAALPFAVAEYQGQIIVNYAETKDSETFALGYENSGSITAYTSFSNVFNPVDTDGSSTSAGRMKFAVGRYLNFCTTTGPKALENYNDQPRTAGLLRMPDPDYYNTAPTVLAGNNWMPYNSSVAYRTLLRRATSDGASLLSPPSGRAIVSNRIFIPVGGLVRTGGTTVTATLQGGDTIYSLGLTTGLPFTLDPGEANFAAGAYTIATLPTSTTFTYASVGANVSSTLDQECDTGPRATYVGAVLNDDAVEGDAVRFYRSLATSASTIEPSDELYLSNEVYLSSTDISNGYVVANDSTPQSVLSDPLYTNPQTGEGANQANYQPPIYRDVAAWDSRLFYANTTGQQSLGLQMLGIGTPDGIQNNDTISFDDGTNTLTLTFKATPAGATDVQIYDSGLASQNILLTLANLIGVFQLQTDGFGWGIYNNSGQDDAPGKFLIERTDFSADPIGVTASRPESWTPALDASTATDTDDNRQPNGLAYSKLSQPEAVPPVNFTNIGSYSYAISRVFGLKNALIICKEGDGIYSLTGSFPYTATQISTANIIAPDCAAVFADSLWVYTDQGILRVSDSGGAAVISRPIETELNRLYDLYPDETFDYAFAVPYEVERRIMFFVPTGTFDIGDETFPVLEAFAYSAATNAWTGPLYYAEDVFSGIVTSDRRLWLGVYDSVFGTSRLMSERKGSTPSWLDKADASWSNTITAVEVNGDPMLIRLGTTANVGQGDGIVQGTKRSKISAHRTDIDTDVYEVAEVLEWTVAACTIYDRYHVELQFLPNGAPASRKTLTRMANLFKPEGFANYYGRATIFTDQIQDTAEIAAPFLGFGMEPFGSGPFGQPTPMIVDTNPIGPPWTNAGQFFPGFVLEEVWAKFKMQGVAMRIDNADAPAGRGK